MRRNTEGIKDLILEIIKKHGGSVTVQDLLDKVNKELENGNITKDKLQKLISDMSDKIKRIPQINNQPEEVELAPTEHPPVHLL